MTANPFRNLPSVTQVLDAAARTPAADAPRPRLVEAVRAELAELRRRLRAGELPNGELTAEAVAARAADRLAAESLPALRPVVNATGIVLHTNLGRAPLAESAASAAAEAGR